MKKILRKIPACRCCSAGDIFMERHLDGERLIFSLRCPACGFCVAKPAGLYDPVEQAKAAQTISRVFECVSG